MVKWPTEPMRPSAARSSGTAGRGVNIRPDWRDAIQAPRLPKFQDGGLGKHHHTMYRRWKCCKGSSGVRDLTLAPPPSLASIGNSGMNAQACCSIQGTRFCSPRRRKRRYFAMRLLPTSRPHITWQSYHGHDSTCQICRLPRTCMSSQKGYAVVRLSHFLHCGATTRNTFYRIS